MSERTEAEVIADAYSPEHMLLRAPVQGYQGGIPWPIHLEAYDAYCKRYGRQTALINLKDRGCRGGFGTGELDEFVPGWRERVSPITEMQQRIVALENELQEVRTAMHLSEQKTADWVKTAKQLGDIVDRRAAEQSEDATSIRLRAEEWMTRRAVERGRALRSDEISDEIVAAFCAVATTEQANGYIHCNARADYVAADDICVLETGHVGMHITKRGATWR